MSFAGKVVLVTGAASGIGAATAVMFAREGAAVAATDIDGDKLELVVKQDARDGRDIVAITADIANDDDAKRIVKETVDKFGKLDVLVNCAGVLRYGKIVDGNLMQTYDELMNINLRAAMQVTCQATPHLIKTKGNIVNIASLSASQPPLVDFIGYCVSKVGLLHFTRGAALELAPHGVRVNSISPGPVRTNLLGNSGRENEWDEWEYITPLKRISEPEDIAEIVLSLASDKSKSITGSDFPVDNGARLFY